MIRAIAATGCLFGTSLDGNSELAHEVMACSRWKRRKALAMVVDYKLFCCKQVEATGGLQLPLGAC